MKLIEKLKKWWFKVTHMKCDYCLEPCKVWYEAYMFPIKEYKGVCMCKKCVEDLMKTEK